MALPPPPVAPAKTFFYTRTDSLAVPAIKNQVFVTNDAGPDDRDIAKTDLGIQTIEGVPAQGTRITRTIPAGEIGNAQPLVITTESWYSPDLKILVMTKSSDPRMGETTYKLTNIQRSQPPAGLFQPPDDYAVKDQPGAIFFNRENKK